jgi:hypothetical protein
MNPRFRIAAFAGLMLLATAGLARAAATSYPGSEKTLEASKASATYVDYSNCPTPQEQQKVQIQAMLQLPGEERGRAIEKGSCAVTTTEEAPSKVDDRYAIGH